MTTPTRSMAKMAHSPPSPPPSAARLGQDSIVGLEFIMGLESIVGSSLVSSIMMVVTSY